MRILTVGNMYPPHHLGGYELMWRSAVLHHRAAGHDVRVLTTDWRERFVDPSMPEDPDVHRDLRWYWYDHDFPRLSIRARRALERHNAATFDRHVEEFAPDAVAWWAMGGMSLSLLGRARGRGLPAAGVVVDDWLLYGPKVDQSWRVGALLRGRLERGVHWLFASRMLLDRAREAGFDSPAEVAYPGIDHDLFHAPPGERPPWRWRLLYVGRIDERKGIDLAVRALAELPDEAQLLVLGGGDEDEAARLRALIAELGLEGRVEFDRRPRAELPAAYAAADVALFPVRWLEPFGLVPLEAMACGTPVVASGRGGSGEYLVDEENCLLFDVDQGAESLAGAIRRLADDRALRAGLHAGGLATAARFAESAYNDACLAAIERAL